jgi:hypothetical protein
MTEPLGDKWASQRLDNATIKRNFLAEENELTDIQQVTRGVLKSDKREHKVGYC